jgi:hypothetical protein
MPETIKPDTPETEEGPKVRTIVHVPESVPARYYANNTEVAMTSFDLSLRFAQIEGADVGNLYVRDQAIISLSLHHAKAVAQILVAHIDQYEKQHGELFIPGAPPSTIPHEAVKVKVDSNS